MATVTYRIDGTLLPIDIRIRNEHYRIMAKAIIDPYGEKSILYDGYSVSLNRLFPNATDIEYYVNKIRNAATLYEEGLSKDDILRGMIREHCNQHNRIIDTDLMMMVSALGRTIKAIEGGCDVNTLRLQALQIALNEYIDMTYVTIFSQNQFEEPQLVSLKEFVKSK